MRHLFAAALAALLALAAPAPEARAEAVDLALVLAIDVSRSVAEGITINGLPILNDRANFGRPPEADLDLYYEHAVIGGPGAFLILARDFNAFGAAILSKLIKEIAGDPAAAARILAQAD